jgi:hypothetical protein
MLRNLFALWRSRRKTRRAAIERRPAVLAHIAHLTVWEACMADVACELALLGPRPTSSECDSPGAFAAAMLDWIEARTLALRPAYPVPVASIPVERSIEIITAIDGSRSYVPVRDEWGHTVYRDHFVQRNKRHHDDGSNNSDKALRDWTPVPLSDMPVWKVER